MVPVKRNVTVWIGNDGIVTIEPLSVDGSVYSPSGAVWILAAKFRTTPLWRLTGTMGNDGVVTFPYTVVDSRKIKLGYKTTYEIECRVSGTERTWQYGYLVGVGGTNSDPSDPPIT